MVQVGSAVILRLIVSLLITGSVRPYLANEEQMLREQAAGEIFNILSQRH